MGKNNVTCGGLEPWDTYKGKSNDEAVGAIHEHVGKYSQEILNWYWKSIGIKKVSSFLSRWSCFVLLLIGAVLPVAATALPQNNQEIAYLNYQLQMTRIGVVVLVLAGLARAADEIFGWSSGWLRYVSTVTAMESLTRHFELDWATYLVLKTGPLDDNDKKLLFDLAKNYQNELSRLQTDETEKWLAAFNNSLSVLTNLISSQRESVQKQVTELESKKEAVQKALEDERKVAEAAQASGSIEVTLKFKKSPLAPVQIGLDSDPLTDFLGTTWTKTDLPPGQHQLTVATKSDPVMTVQKVVVVTPGNVANVDVDIPSNELE